MASDIGKAFATGVASGAGAAIGTQYVAPVVTSAAKRTAKTVNENAQTIYYTSTIPACTAQMGAALGSIAGPAGSLAGAAIGGAAGAVGAYTLGQLGDDAYNEGRASGTIPDTEPNCTIS